jgi:hypothetical protein
MTEAEWNACTDPMPMLEFLPKSGRASVRKLRLFACACCRRIWHLLAEEWSRQGVEEAERHADGLCSDEQLEEVRKRAGWAAAWAGQGAAAEAAAWAASGGKEQGWVEITAARAAWAEAPSGGPCPFQSAILRDIFGNPFHPLRRLDPSLRRGYEVTIVPLAQAVYQERSLPRGTLDNERLGILADALEEASCLDQAILGHCRHPGLVHVRGCWVVDYLLDRQ